MKYQKYEKLSKKSSKEAKNVKQLLKRNNSGDINVPKLTLEEREIIAVQNVNDIQGSLINRSLYGM